MGGKEKSMVISDWRVIECRFYEFIHTSRDSDATVSQFRWWSY